MKIEKLFVKKIRYFFDTFIDTFINFGGRSDTFQCSILMENKKYRSIENKVSLTSLARKLILFLLRTNYYVLEFNYFNELMFFYQFNCF